MSATVQAVFPRAAPGVGMYESFYLRAVAPGEPVGAWLRYTVHKRPGERPRGSLWCTVFDARAGRPYMHKLTTDELSAPAGAWIAIGPAARLGAGRAEGACGQARWSLRWETDEEELRHLPSGWMYRAPLPRTKLTSPAPDARFSGELELAGRPALRLEGWRGMVGHNWGAEHAERWIWLHGVGFAQDETAWLDVALGRIRVAGRLTPWVANGALRLGGEASAGAAGGAGAREAGSAGGGEGRGGGERFRIGGLGRRGLRVEESAEGCELWLPGPRGLRVHARVRVPPQSAAGWRYADPDGGEHEVVNCSVAAIELDVTRPETQSRAPLRLESAHGAAYELGMGPGEPHGVPLAQFPDG